MNKEIQIPFEVIERFALRNDISLEIASEIHEELLSYLDEGQIIKSKTHSPSKVVDEAWHSFILHTKLYSEFCMNRYGSIVHHFPFSKTIDPTSKVKSLLEKRELQMVAGCSDGSGDCGNSD